MSWISVEKELPAAGMLVDIVYGKRSTRVTDVYYCGRLGWYKGHYVGTKRLDQIEGTYPNTVTHWAYIPHKPKLGKNVQT